MQLQKIIMTISIIIPAYNVGKYLDECLGSCLRQDLDVSGYEIIIVNDGSTDGTLDIAQAWASRHSNIKVISQENRGLSEARNAGMEVAEGDYIMFVDSDDLISENILGRLARTCTTHSPDMLRICAADMIGNNVRRRYSYKAFTGLSSGKALLRTRFSVCAPFSIYRRGFLNEYQLRFHPGIYHEDNEFTPRAYYLAERVISIDDIVYLVRQTPNSITRSASSRKSLDLLKVAGLLDAFAQEKAGQEYRKYFDKQISDCLNVCLRNMLNLNPEDRESLKQRIRENRKLFRHFRRSSSLSHRIEGILLTLFPGKMLEIFRILDMIHTK